MVSDEHGVYGKPLRREILDDLAVVVVKARGFQHHHAPAFFEEEHLVVDEIAGLIGVQFYGAEIVHVHLAFGKCDPCERIFVHVSSSKRCIFVVIISITTCRV